MRVQFVLNILSSFALLFVVTNALDDYSEYLARSPVFLPPPIPPGSGGMPCTNSTDCNKSASLICRDGKFSCILPEEMTYSSITRACGMNLGKSCKHPIIISDLPHEIYIGCTINTICGPDEKCICNPDQYEDDHGICFPKGRFNEACQNDAQCIEGSGLECKYGRLECSSSLNLIYQDISYICVVKAGAIATGHHSCIIGAVKNVNRVCTCQPEDEYFAGTDGTCHLRGTQGFGDTCSDSRGRECKWEGTYLSCINGRCTFGPGSTFREFLGSKSVEAEKNNLQFNMSVKKEFKQCVGLAGSGCNLDEHCVQFSSCKSSTCTCDVGYWQTRQGTCGLEHGQLCSASIDCSDSFVCTNGKCSCPEPSHQAFNESTGVCHSLVQGNCLEDWECVENSICANSTGINGSQCFCREGYVENEIGYCDLAFGTECDYGSKSTPCDTLAELKCQNLKCSCPDSLNMYFDPNLRQCLVLAGSFCKIGDRNCGTNSECRSKHSKLNGICNCSMGFKANVERRCFA